MSFFLEIWAPGEYTWCTCTSTRVLYVVLPWTAKLLRGMDRQIYRDPKAAKPLRFIYRHPKPAKRNTFIANHRQYPYGQSTGTGSTEPCTSAHKLRYHRLLPRLQLWLGIDVLVLSTYSRNVPVFAYLHGARIQYLATGRYFPSSLPILVWPEQIDLFDPKRAAAWQNRQIYPAPNLRKLKIDRFILQNQRT